VDLCGTVALVTGSSRGLAEQAARVAVHDRAGHEAAQETLGLLVGGQHAVFGANLSDAGTARGLLEDDVAREMGRMDVLGIGRIDKLVNNAGISESPRTRGGLRGLAGRLVADHRHQLHRSGEAVLSGRPDHDGERRRARGERLVAPLLTLAIFSAIAAFSETIGSWLRTRPRLAGGLGWLTGCVLISLGLRLALRLALQDRRQTPKNT
jgi:NAD(P)-dependent dehydrogenase (short-subunit alcohol dehydrogenase family)